MIPTVLWLLYDFLPLKNDENVASKSNKQKTCRFEGHWRKLHDPDPDPLVRGPDLDITWYQIVTDPQH